MLRYLCYAMLRNAMLAMLAMPALLRYAALCYATLCYATLWYAMLRYLSYASYAMSHMLAMLAMVVYATPIPSAQRHPSDTFPPIPMAQRHPWHSHANMREQARTQALPNAPAKSRQTRSAHPDPHLETRTLRYAFENKTTTRHSTVSSY